MTELSIRPLDPNDHESRLLCAQIMTSSEPWVTLGRTQEEVLNILNAPISESYLAISNGTTIGFAIIVMTGAWVGYIRSIVIKPEYRKQGFGTSIIRELESKIFLRFPNVFLCVSSFNPRAKKWYKSMGYKEIGELKDYVIPGHSEFIMRKTIGSLQGYKGQPH